MTMRQLITYEDITRLARPCSADEEMVTAMIAEAEREDVKRQIGDGLYIAVKADEPEPKFNTLIEGGEWADCSGRKHYLTGLKTALAYYVYARIVRDGNIQATRYGSRVKDDDNSIEAINAELQRQYREAFSSADLYMGEVIGYIKANRDIFTEYTCEEPHMTNNRVQLRIIGAGAKRR